ncbi:MAG: phosphodiester glycosidase family protein [Calditrichae bacterium]|nr:phosphodiester glycosidase family protein [Calditrichia bacterium]
MKNKIICVLLLLFALNAFSQNYQYKTISEKSLTAGIVFKKITESTMPWSINLAEIDLNAPGLQIMAVTAFDSLAGNRMTSAMAADQKKKGMNVRVATNADFYEEGGYSTNYLVADGQLVSMAHKGFSAIGFDNQNKPFINHVNFESLIITPNSRHKISGINKERLQDELIVYNRFNGKSTRTNKWGAEAQLRLLGTPLVNDTLIAVVEKKQKQRGNMAIPENKIVMSGHDQSALWINEMLKAGDTVKLVISLNGMPENLEDLLGGFTQLVKNGKNSAMQSFEEEGNPAVRERFALARHPRTAVGFNKEKSKLFLMTVDGRQPASAGMTLEELGDYMTGLGCWQALNFDGGGSTTMVIDGKVVNVPSDPTGERAVATALMIIKN